MQIFEKFGSGRELGGRGEGIGDGETFFPLFFFLPFLKTINKNR